MRPLSRLSSYVPRSHGIFDAYITPLGTVGESRHAAHAMSKMNSPAAVAYSRTGDLAVADTGHRRVCVFGVARTLIHSIGRYDPVHNELLRFVDVGVPQGVTWTFGGSLLSISKKGSVFIHGPPTKVAAGVLGKLPRSFFDAVSGERWRERRAWRPSPGMVVVMVMVMMMMVVVVVMVRIVGQRRAGD
jgi:hypothetical protein